MARFSRVLLLALAGCFSGCSPAQYVAQPASVEETRDTVRSMKVQQDELLKRIQSLEQALESGLAGNRADLNAELGSLADALESISDRLSDLSGQMQRRSSRNVPPPPLEGGPPAPYDTSEVSMSPGLPGGSPDASAHPGEPTPGDQTGAPAIDPETVYDAAYRDVSRGSYPLAVAGFQEFLRLFPDHSLADNAQYWIGECYYVQNDAGRARDEFRKVLDGYPDGDKVPAAYLKLGYSALKLNNSNEARRYLDELIQKYPRSEEARSARQKLSTLQ